MKGDLKTDSQLKFLRMPDQVFKVSYSKDHISKKYKTYHEGIITSDKGTVSLFDQGDANILFKSFTGRKYSVGETILLRNFHVEVQELIENELFVSGKVFAESFSFQTDLAKKTSSNSFKPSTNNSISLPPPPSAVKKFQPLQLKPPLVDRASVNAHAPSKDAIIKPVVTTTPKLGILPLGISSSSFVLEPGVKSSSDNLNSVTPRPVQIDSFLNSKLRPFQRDGVKFLYDCIKGQDFSSPSSTTPITGYGAILVDEMGLGKTLQTITLLYSLISLPSSHKSKVHKAIIVCPSTLVENWKKEIKKWLGDVRLKPLVVSTYGKLVLEGLQTFLHGNVNPVLIISYEMLRKYIDQFSNCKSVNLLICDEAHRLKSISQDNKTINALSMLTKKRILLTGTPIQNNLLELFGICSFANPGVLGSLQEFKKHYETGIKQSCELAFDKDDVNNESASELRSILSKFVLRRSSSTIEKYLPLKIDVQVFLELSELQKRLYSKVISYYNNDPSLSLNLIHLLRQICTHPDLVYLNLIDENGEKDSTTVISKKRPLKRDEESEDGEDTLDDDDGENLDTSLLSSKHILDDLRAIFPSDYMLGNPSSSSKLQFVHTLIQSIQESNKKTPSSIEKVVIVSNYTKTLDLVEKSLSQLSVSCLRLDGQVPGKKRIELVNEFNTFSNSNVLVFLLSSSAGGAGVNLIGGNHLVMLDSNWNPAIDFQAKARIWRMGQLKPCSIYSLISSYSLEEKVLQRHLMKMNLAEKLNLDTIANGNERIGNQPSSSSRFSVEELKALFRLDPSSFSGTGCDTRTALELNSTLRWPAFSLSHVSSLSSFPHIVNATSSLGSRVTYMKWELFNMNPVSEKQTITPTDSCR
jgi:SNF2-related domain/Helicase conserved C-terminal domain